MNLTILDPERLGVPSASSAYARRRCLGREHLIRSLREGGQLPTPLSTPDALSGTQVHAAWAGEKVELDTFQSETLEALMRLESMLVADWSHGEAASLFAREQRLWIHKGIEPIHSGRYDVAYINHGADRMLIIDGKTLFGEVEPAETNDQLRELVALAHHAYPSISEFTVALLQPRCYDRRVSVATYDFLEAELALRMLLWHLEEIKDPTLPRHAGDWCKHCPAITVCPEAVQLVTKATVGLELEAEDKRWVLPIGEEGKIVLDRLLTAKPLIERYIGFYKQALTNDPDAVPGYKLKPGNTVRSIDSVIDAWKIAKDFMTIDEFLSTVEITMGRLETIFGKKQKLTGKFLRAQFNERFDEVLGFSTNAPSLEKAK